MIAVIAVFKNNTNHCIVAIHDCNQFMGSDVEIIGCLSLSKHVKKITDLGLAYYC